LRRSRSVTAGILRLAAVAASPEIKRPCGRPEAGNGEAAAAASAFVRNQGIGKAIIEAQQKVFDADPNYQLLAIGADAALTYFRWALARRIEAETSAAKAA